MGNSLALNQAHTPRDRLPFAVTVRAPFRAISPCFLRLLLSRRSPTLTLDLRAFNSRRALFSLESCALAYRNREYRSLITRVSRRAFALIARRKIDLNRAEGSRPSLPSINIILPLSIVTLERKRYILFSIRVLVTRSIHGSYYFLLSAVNKYCFAAITRMIIDFTDCLSLRSSGISVSTFPRSVVRSRDYRRCHQ